MQRSFVLIWLLWFMSLGFAAPETSVSKPKSQATNVIVVFGDSLSAAHGIAISEGWVALLEKRLAREGFKYTVINASISGEMTAGGVERLARLMRRYRDAIFIVELGGNDGLQGLKISDIKKNIGIMLKMLRDKKHPVLLVGVRLPPNYGDKYTQAFERMYVDLARKYQVPLLPLMLEGIDDVSGMMLPDGIHPTAAAQPRILENVWPKLLPLLY